jgi:hypothetical protein
MSIRGKRWFQGAILALAFGALLCLGQLMRTYAFAHLSPPDGATNFVEFAERMPPATRLYFADVNGVTFIVWIGEDSRYPVPSSGPACYVFDSYGQLYDWCDETGDGHPVDRFYRLRRNAQPRTLEEVQERLQARECSQIPRDTAPRSPQALENYGNNSDS